MCCNTKPGPRLAIDLFKERTGLHVTQEDWHSIRTVAEESLGRPLSTSIADAKEAATAAAEYALSLELDKKEALNFIRNFSETKNTEGTVDAVKYLAENGLPEEIAKKRIKKAARKGTLTDQQLAKLRADYGDILDEIAGASGTDEQFVKRVQESIEWGSMKRRRSGSQALAEELKDDEFRDAMNSLLVELTLKDVQKGAYPAPNGYTEENAGKRGHAFFPKKDTIPALYETDGISFKEKEIVAHYTMGISEWYVAEYDPETGEAFGYADLNGNGKGEWSYFSLPEVEGFEDGGIIAERDLWWSATPFEDIER